MKILRLATFKLYIADQLQLFGIAKLIFKRPEVFS